MLAWAGPLLLAIAATCIAAASGAAQTAPVSREPPQRLKAAQPRPLPRAPTAAASGDGQAIAKANEWTLGLATGLPEESYLRVGGEIARNLNVQGKLRVIPMVTPGAVENIRDLLYLKGVDVAFTNADVLDYFKTVEKIPNIDKRVHYIAELFIDDIHVLVRPEIRTYQDLERKKVSFHSPGSGASVSAPVIFRRLGVKVDPVYIDNALAIEKMKTGEFAGLVSPGSKPQDLLTKFKNDYGFKFLSIPFEKFDEYYVPSVLTDKDYPTYIKPGEKVDTIAVPVVLAVYNWPKDSDRFRRLERFVEYFFDRFEGFQKPPYSSGWKSVNLAAKVPGWTRFLVAEDMLRQTAPAGNAKQEASPSAQQLAGQPAKRAAPTNSTEQERLFREFLEWSKSSRRQQ